jgi:hypothetical protein
LGNCHEMYTRLAMDSSLTFLPAAGDVDAPAIKR